VENLLYIVRIKILAARAEVSSISTQGRQIVIKPQTPDSPLRIRRARGVMSRHLEGAVKIGATQVKLDVRLLGDRWKVVLEEILDSSDVRNFVER
jgi:hypothetical protein